jgi:hypothetical protein
MLSVLANYDAGSMRVIGTISALDARGAAHNGHGQREAVASYSGTRVTCVYVACQWPLRFAQT